LIHELTYSSIVRQDAEKVRQHRSRIVQTFNVPQRVRLGPSLAAALLTVFLSILRERSSVMPHARAVEILASYSSYPAAC
jgi:hypothetical protein